MSPSKTCLWIKIHDQIKVIAHDRKGIDGDCEVLSQMPHALLEPISTMFIVFAGESINTTQPTSAHTPRNDVVVHGIVGINQLVSGCWHVLILLERTSNLWRTLAYRDGGVHLILL